MYPTYHSFIYLYYSHNHPIFQFSANTFLKIVEKREEIVRQAKKDLLSGETKRGCKAYLELKVKNIENIGVQTIVQRVRNSIFKRNLLKKRPELKGLIGQREVVSE